MSAAISLLRYRAASSLRSTFRIFPRSGSTAWNSRSRACFALPPASHACLHSRWGLRFSSKGLPDGEDEAVSGLKGCNGMKGSKGPKGNVFPSCHTLQG